MSQANDQMIEWNKAVMQAAIRFAGIVLEGTEHMLQVQMKAVKGAVADGTQRAKALAEAESPQEFGQLKGALAQPDLEKAADYFKSVYEVAAATQAEINQLVEEQFAVFNKRLTATANQSANPVPAGSEFAMAAFKSAISTVNTAFDSMSKAGKQFSNMGHTNVEAVTSQAVHASRKKHT